MNEYALEISNILNQLLRLSHISESELARKINIPRATINRLTSGRTPDPRASTLNAIAEYFDVSVDQLLGKQPLYLNNQQSKLSTKNKSIPIVDWKHCNKWENSIEKLKPDTHLDWIVIDPTMDDATFAVRTNSESMWPQFQMNTILIIAPSREAKNRDFVIAYIKENNEVVFRQLIVENKYKFLKAINDIFPTIRLNNGDQIIGVVIQTRNTY